MWNVVCDGIELYIIFFCIQSSVYNWKESTSCECHYVKRCCKSICNTFLLMIHSVLYSREVFWPVKASYANEIMGTVVALVWSRVALFCHFLLFVSMFSCPFTCMLSWHRFPVFKVDMAGMVIKPRRPVSQSQTLVEAMFICVVVGGCLSSS